MWPWKKKQGHGRGNQVKLGQTGLQWSMTGVFIRERDWKFGHTDTDTTQREDGIVKTEKKLE